MGGQFIILFLFLIVASFYDIKYNRIPNWLNVSGVIIGIVYHLIFNQLDGFIHSITGMFVGGGVLFILYLFKAIGAGDVKLFAAIGALAGVLFTLYSIMYSIIFAGIIGLIILLFTKTFFINMTLAFLHIKESIQKRDLTPLDEFKNNISNRFPFIYAVVPGVIVSYYYMFLV
ncbi:A24 family peptidase [Paucisalibacillus globulus]|uniref:A24 family peptidase n=1 Tax=Paucisalibacillus globulus TaxID=351095 RepID=UPI00041349B2|nr:prepilin peptidase [Paucisalibacillus globulus]